MIFSFAPFLAFLMFLTIKSSISVCLLFQKLSMHFFFLQLFISLFLFDGNWSKLVSAYSSRTFLRG